jgi:hypothetical protein
MLDRWIYKFLSGIDFIFDNFIPSIYERLKNTIRKGINYVKRRVNNIK